jgi:hypothetical protein
MVILGRGEAGCSAEGCGVQVRINKAEVRQVVAGSFVLRGTREDGKAFAEQ